MVTCRHLYTRPACECVARLWRLPPLVCAVCARERAGSRDGSSVCAPPQPAFPGNWWSVCPTVSPIALSSGAAVGPHGLFAAGIVLLVLISLHSLTMPPKIEIDLVDWNCLIDWNWSGNLVAHGADILKNSVIFTSSIILKSQTGCLQIRNCNAPGFLRLFFNKIIGSRFIFNAKLFVKIVVKNEYLKKNCLNGM